MEMPKAMKDQIEADAIKEAEENARIEAAEKEQAAADAADADQTPVADKPVATPEPEVRQEPEPNTQVADDKRDAEIERLRGELAQVEQRWRTAQGMLSKRDGEKDEALRRLMEKVQALEKRSTEPVTPKEKAYLKHLTPEEKQAFSGEGSEPAELRMARGEIESLEERTQRLIDKKMEEAKVAALKEIEVETRRQSDELAANTSFKHLCSKVEELAPGFNAANNDPKSNFCARFLDMPDPMRADGGTYRTSASEMVSAGDPRGIAKLFAEYQALDPSGSKAKSLEGQVKPDTSRSTGKPTTQPGAPVFTKGDYDAFWRFKQTGRFPPNQDGTVRTKEQIDKLEAQLEEAFNSGKLADR